MGVKTSEINQSKIFEVIKYWYASCDDKIVANRSYIVDDSRRTLARRATQCTTDWVAEDKSEILDSPVSTLCGHSISVVLPCRDHNIGQFNFA